MTDKPKASAPFEFKGHAYGMALSAEERRELDPPDGDLYGKALAHLKEGGPKALEVFLDGVMSRAEKGAVPPQKREWLRQVRNAVIGRAATDGYEAVKEALSDLL